MRHIVGKLLRSGFQIYILLWVKNLSFFIFALLPKQYKNSLSYKYYQKLFVGFTFFYMYQSIPFYMYVKKTPLEFFRLLIPEILPFQTFFYQKVSMPHFCCSKLWASGDISLESSSGVDFKYMYFYESKLFRTFIYCLIIFSLFCEFSHYSL